MGCHDEFDEKLMIKRGRAAMTLLTKSGRGKSTMTESGRERTAMTMTEVVDNARKGCGDDDNDVDDNTQKGCGDDEGC